MRCSDGTDWFVSSVKTDANLKGNPQRMTSGIGIFHSGGTYRLNTAQIHHAQIHHAQIHHVQIHIMHKYASCTNTHHTIYIIQYTSHTVIHIIHIYIINTQCTSCIHTQNIHHAQIHHGSILHKSLLIIIQLTYQIIICSLFSPS